MSLLGIFSPSKVFTVLGKYTGEGFANGILAMITNVKKASNILGNKAVVEMSKAVSYSTDSFNDNAKMNPSIRPVIDLTDIIAGAKDIDNLISKKDFGVVPSMFRVSNIADSMQDVSSNNLSDKIEPGISLVQNNYSPKALSKLDIYRQTKNQLSTLKGLV